MKRFGKTTIMLIAFAITAVLASGIAVYAAWSTFAVTKNTNNVIKTGDSVTYTLTGDLDASGLLPEGVVTQELTLGGIEASTTATLAVTNMVAVKTEGGETVTGIDTHLTYALYDETGTTPVTMTTIAADGVYKLKFTLHVDTPATFANCTITYTLTLTKNA